jgi:hypothetical protein
MARARKTIEVATALKMANTQLARKDVSIESRQALSLALSKLLLFEAIKYNAYNGFNYVYWSKEGGHEAWVAADRPANDFPEKNAYIYGNNENTHDYRRFNY